MGRRLVIGGVIFLALWAVVLGVFLWLRFGGEQQPVRVGSSVVVPTPPLVSPGAPAPTGSQSWAEQMLSKYPYKKGSYSGTLPAKRSDEVWVVGFKIGTDNFYPPNQQYMGVENKYGKFHAKLFEGALFTVQEGDDLAQTAQATAPATIKDGSLVAARMTYANDFGLVLEVRRLIPIPQ